jgi:hypothetical protein
MNLPTVSLIEAGTSILFLGAGFSAEATNTNDEEMKDVSALITYLLDKAGITATDGYDLDTAAEEFQKVHGNEATIIALHSNFRTKNYTANQETIVIQPWRRIYTPNYDDVIETICCDNRKPITTHGVKDPVSEPMPGTTQLLHIYGNIGKASADEFAETFLQKASLKASIETAIRSIVSFKHPDRFRNLTDLRSRLAGAVKALT